MSIHKSHLIPLLVLFAVLVLLTGCSISHETMRGSIVMKLDDEAHICIGSDDGIRVGDILTVFRIKVDNIFWLREYQERYPAPGRTKTTYQKIKVGEVTVTEIFDGHFAAVKLVNGELQASDIVEKQRRR